MKRTRSGCGCVLAALCLLASTHVHAQQVVKPAELRLRGFAPDAQVVGGVGFGFGAKLKNYFLARGRLGLLYADEPWMVNVGATVEVGALGRFGAGAEIELNADRGLFGAVGLARVVGNDWMSHVSVGFTVLGIEWQHRFGDERPSDALLFEVRLPLGTWWFVKQHEPPETTAHAGFLQPRVIVPRSPPSAAGPAAAAQAQATAPSGAEPTPAAEGSSQVAVPSAATEAAASQGAAPPGVAASGAGVAASQDAAASDAAAAQGAAAPRAPATGSERVPAPSVRAAPAANAPATQPPSAAAPHTAVLVPPAPDPARLQEAQAPVAQARAAHDRGQSGDAALLLARAYTLAPEPAIALQLAAAEEAHGRWLLAAGDLRLVLAAHALPEAEQRRVSEQLAQLEARTPKLRLRLDHSVGDEVVTIDGAEAPVATLGYDVAVDPGEHAIQVSRRGRELARGSFNAVPKELARVTLDLTP